MIWKAFSHKLEGPSEPYFRTLVYLTVKNILQFTNTNILSWSFWD